DVIPVQFPGLLGTDADSQAQHHVGVQPGLPRRLEQREGLRQGKRPARPPDLARGVVDQSRHVPADQVVRLGIPDRPGEGSPGHLQVPGRHFAAERLEPSAHIAGRQLPQRLEADVLQQRLERLTVDGPRALRPPRQAALQPVVHRLPDRVRRRSMQAAVKLIVDRFELVPDLRLGPAADLAPDPLAVRAEADRDRPDVAVLRRIEVDRVLAVTATARCVVRYAGSVTLFLAPRLAPRLGSDWAYMASELVVRGRVELPTFRFSASSVIPAPSP